MRPSASDARGVIPVMRPASRLRVKGADASTSTPTMVTRGAAAFTIRPTPLASPPPPSGTTTTSNDGIASIRSRPTVPAPAITSGLLYGEM